MDRYNSLSGGYPKQTTHLSPHIDHISRTARLMGLLGPLLKRSEFSIRNGVLLYKQRIRSLMDYACPVWRSAARTLSGDYTCYNPSVFVLLRRPLLPQ
jgi:hypothetical protein